jgi:hypothetical protein
VACIIANAAARRLIAAICASGCSILRNVASTPPLRLLTQDLVRHRATEA